MAPLTANQIGFSLVVLSLVFAAAAMIRRVAPPLRALFLPTAVIGGFLVLFLGPEVLGRIVGGHGVFSPTLFAVWSVLPGLLINVLAASLMLGERLPAPKIIWSTSGAHVLMAFAMSGGQFALAGILVLLLLGPLFGMSDKAAALIEMSFAGGPGTLAGMKGVFAAYGAGELVDVGFGLATIGMVTSIGVGTLLVNHAIKSPSITVARDSPPAPEEDLDLDHHQPGPDSVPMDEWNGMKQVTAAAVFLGVSIALGILLHVFFRWAGAQLGSQFFEMFPTFPFTIIGGTLVQLCAARFHFERSINRRAVEGLGGLATDGIIICAIGTLSLATLGANVVPLIVLSAASIAWSVSLTYFLGRRIFRRNWFEHAIPEYGESQGNVACGFVMLDMVDPARKTDANRGYGYRQLLTRPFLGGGFVTALSVPFIAVFGLPLFTVAAAALTIGAMAWAIRRARRSDLPQV